MEYEICVDVIKDVIEMHKAVLRSRDFEQKWKDALDKAQRFNSEILLENNQLKNSPVNSNHQMNMANDLISKLQADVVNHKKTILELADKLNQLKKRDSVEIELK